MRCNKVFLYFCCLIFSLNFFSCSNTTLQTTPQSFGGLNEILVVTDKEIWDGQIGDTLRYYMGAAYPVLPQPEPLFDLRFLTVNEFHSNPQNRNLRNILFLGNVKDQNSLASNKIRSIVGDEIINEFINNKEEIGTKINKNRWASNQNVVMMYAQENQALADGIKARSASIAKLIRDDNKNMINTRTYMRGKSASIIQSIKDQYEMLLPVPGEYVVAMNDTVANFMWLRKMENDFNANIMVYKEKYSNTNQLTPEYLKSLRDTIGYRYITSNVEGSFMRIDDVNLPTYFEKDPVEGKFAIQLRGIWQMSDRRDAMGGPFMTYFIHVPDTDDLILIDAFLYAPGRKKRDLMQELEYIFSGISFDF